MEEVDLSKGYQNPQRKLGVATYFSKIINLEYTNREITTTWYYVNSGKHVDSEKIRVPDGIWTHDPPWSSRMFYHWATGDSVVSKGQIVGIDWDRIARLHLDMP